MPIHTISYQFWVLVSHWDFKRIKIGLSTRTVTVLIFTLYQWEFQDPKMEVLYHIRPYFVEVFAYIGLT
jgi:hypothetical protein